MGRVVIPGFRKIETSGGGEGGTSNYNDLTNKPSINNVPLVGNLNTVDLKLTDKTLTEEGVPAEAKTVGAKLEEHSASLTALSEQLGNHTVKSDVPENAVFTDTVYDDTEVQKIISDNGYGEVAGGKNLFQSSNTFSGINTLFNLPINLKPNTTYTFSLHHSNDGGAVQISVTDDSNNIACDSTIIINFGKPSTESVTFSTNSIKATRIGLYSNAEQVISNIQVEEGSVATEYEPYFPSNKMLAEEKADKSETTVNLLNPTLGTTTVNGITCTNNGDGTYTVDGKATSITALILQENVSWDALKRLTGCPKGGASDKYYLDLLKVSSGAQYMDIGEGTTITQSNSGSLRFVILENITITNAIVKPMLTTNLDATYDDFVSYTGDTGKLNSDVASLLKRIETLESLVNKTDTTTVETE